MSRAFFFENPTCKNDRLRAVYVSRGPFKASRCEIRLKMQLRKSGCISITMGRIPVTGGFNE